MRCPRIISSGICIECSDFVKARAKVKDYIVSVFSVLNNASEMHDDSIERTPDR